MECQNSVNAWAKLEHRRYHSVSVIFAFVDDKLNEENELGT